MTMAAMYGKNSEGVRRLSGKRLFIYGAGGLGRDVLRLSRRINLRSARWSEISFVDDGCLKKKSTAPLFCGLMRIWPSAGRMTPL